MEDANSAAPCTCPDTQPASVPTHIQDTLQSRRDQATSAYRGLSQDMRDLITQDCYVQTYMDSFPPMSY